MPLNAEDDIEVFLFVTVVQKTIVPDFLKPIWEYMHHQAAYKFICKSSNMSTGKQKSPHFSGD